MQKAVSTKRVITFDALIISVGIAIVTRFSFTDDSIPTNHGLAGAGGGFTRATKALLVVVTLLSDAQGPT